MRGFLLSLLLVCSAMVQAKTIEGIEFPDTLSVGESKLVLNGASLRRKYGMFKVYVVGLYAPERTKDAAALIGSDKPRRLVMVFLRSVDRKKIMDSWTTGFQKNCGDDCVRGKESFDKFNNSMQDVDKGDKVILDFAKDGATLTFEPADKKPGSTGSIKDPLFARDLLSIFIGPHPATEDLKTDLLGSSK